MSDREPTQCPKLRGMVDAEAHGAGKLISRETAEFLTMVDTPFDLRFDYTPDQETAFNIADRLEKGGPGMWIGMDPKDLANSLRERIRDPTSVYQATIPACAPAAIAVDLARSRPALYAETIRGLYRNGYAYLPGPGFGGPLVAADSVRGKDYHQVYGVMTRERDYAADWVLLSSIRNSESWGNYYWGTRFPLGWASGMTLPSTFEKWLRGFGYTNIINDTNLLLTMSKCELVDASSFFYNKWRVFLFINADMMGTQQQTNTSIFPNHYAVLLSEVTFKLVGNTQCVNFICSSWGKPKRVPENPTVPLSVENFCKNFYGYIAARD